MVHKFLKLSEIIYVRKPFLSWAILVINMLFPIFWLVSCSAKQTHVQPLLLLEHHAEGKSQIYTANPDGSQLTLVTEIPLSNWYWLSPDATHLAFLAYDQQEASYHLNILDIVSGMVIADIPQVRQTWSEHIPWGENVVWSPQGDKLVFLRSSENGKEPDIFLYDLNTKEETQLTYTTAVESSSAWSPDGQQIAFASWNGCEQNDCSPEEEYWDIVTMNSDGSNQQTITDFQDMTLLPRDRWLASLCNLTWSPDATYITFENECGNLMAPYYLKEVFIASVNGSEVRRLTSFTDAHDLNSGTLPDTAFDYSLHWSPDSDTLFIGYSIIAVTPDGRSHGGMLAMTPNGDPSTFLPDTEDVMGSTARWSPNSEYVAWHTQSVDPERYIAPEQTTVGKMEADHISILNGQRDIPVGPCARLGIHWSLDSKFVAYIVNKPGTSCGDVGVDQSIAIVSFPDLTFTQIAEPFEGDFQLIGWTYNFKE